MGKVVVIVVLAALAVLGLRMRSQYQLEERVASYREALRLRALAPRSGVDSVPSEELIVERAQAIARELGVDVRELDAKVTRDADPTGVGGMAAEQVGELPGAKNVDAEGNVIVGAPRKLRTTLVEVHGRVHAKGFLCEVDEAADAHANLGYALQ